MSVLDTLLQMEIPKPQTKRLKQKRLSKHAGEDVVFTVKEVGYSRVAEIREMSDDDVDVHIVLAGTVEPDWKDEGLQEKYGAVTPAELVKKLLLPGEITDLGREIEKLSGFRVSTLEDLEKK